MATVDQTLTWARSQVGTVEHGGPHGNDGNLVAYWDQIGLHGDQGQPWCAAFTSAAFLAAGVPVPAIVYCPSAENWYRSQGRLYARNQGEPGDQAFYNFGAVPYPGHTGIVESINMAAGTVTCIEGNTSPGEAGSQSNGGGVYRRTRPLAQVRSFGRPPYAVPPPAPTPAPPAPVPPLDLPGDDDMPLQLLTINAGPLGQHGEGAMLFDGGEPGGGIAHNVPIRWEQCRGVEVQGSFPPDDGYWPLPKVGRQERGGWLCVELVGGAPGQNPVNLLITVAD